jgi:hypothetical protein
MSNPIGASGAFGKWDKPLWLVLFAVVCAIALWLRIANPAVTARSPDERYYMYYATKVVDSPLHAPRDFVIAYNKSPKNWIYPIPLRVAYYYSIAAIMKLFRLPAEQAGVALSTAASILQFLLIAVFGLRFFGRWPALVTLTFLTASPQDLAMARRVWGDGVSGCLAMLLLWLCAEIFTRPRARLWYAAFWLSSIYFLLVKETGGIFFGLCILALALHSWRQHRSLPKIARLLAASIITAAAAFAIMATLCGGISPALETVHHSAQAAPTNIYGATYQSGPWYSIPLCFSLLCPGPAFASIAALVAILNRCNPLEKVLNLDTSSRAIAIALAAFIILIITAATIPPALKNLRYVSFIFGPFYLVAALGMAYLAQIIATMFADTQVRRAGRWVLCLLSIIPIISSAYDYQRFQEAFVHSDIKDLNVRQIMTFPFDNAPPWPPS